MTVARRFFTPLLDRINNYDAADRPGTDVRMLHDFHSQGGLNNNLNDSATGTNYNFGNTLSGSDIKVTNLSHVWRHNSGYGQLGAYCKNLNYISVHLGYINGHHGFTDCRYGLQHKNPGVYGIRFQYRYPNGNHWSNAPIHIGNTMMHYYSTVTGNYKSYAASCYEANTALAYYPDRYVDNDGRKSDTWKGTWYRVTDNDARNSIRDEQNLFWVGLSMEIVLSKRGSASHTRLMDIRNLTPVWGVKSGANYLPIIGKESTDNWKIDERRVREYYLI